MQVSEAYVAVLRMEGALQVAQSHVDSLNAHNEDVKNLYDQGMVAKNDLLAVNVELANAQQLVVQASNGSPYKSMQVVFYQRVTGIGITNKNLQVNAS